MTHIDPPTTPVPPITSTRPPTGFRGRGGSAWGRWLLIGIVVAYVAVLIVAPIAGLIFSAFADGIGAALSTFTLPDVQGDFVLTLTISAIVVAVHGVLGTLAAWVLVRFRFPGRGIVNALVDLPFALSPVVAGYILLLLFGTTGIFSGLEDTLNIQIVFAVPGMVLATLFVTLPFMIRELIPVIEALDIEQERAAATLGAGQLQTFWRVVFPALRGAILYGLALTFARAIGEFGAVLVVGGAIEGETETAPLYIFRALDERNSVGASTIALALGVLSLALVLGLEWIRRRERR